MTRIGPQMKCAAEIVKLNPGCSIKFVAERISPHPMPEKNWALGYEPVHRAIAAGLIKAVRIRSRYVLTAPEKGM
jgi:hypothetical protein